MECERGIRFPRDRSFHLVSCRQMAAFRGELSGPARIHAQEERAFARLAGPDANSGQPVDEPGRVQEERQLTADQRVEAVSARHRGGADEFMVARAQGAMEKILKTTPDGTEREHIVIQFTRVIRVSADFYPLI